MSKFSERCSIIDDLKAQVNQLGLTRVHLHKDYFDEAVKCFHKCLPISCIVVSSALVERTLFWQYRKQNPPKAGDTMRKPNLGVLFKEFVKWDVLRNSLLDTDEQEDIRLIEESKKKDCGIPKAIFNNFIKYKISRVRYIETRNLFAHGKELLLPVHTFHSLSHLLPAQPYASLEYGINSRERNKPTVETVAYVHLSKTLHFIKAFTIC